MNTKLFRPFSACAQHARKKYAFGFLLWPLGMALVLSLASPHISQGASLASIMGSAYVDVDLDGKLDNGEWAVGCATIQLYRQATIADPLEFVNEVYTDKHGKYSFDNLAPGLYTIVNATPSSRGNTPSVGFIVNGNIPVNSGLGTPNSSMVQISGIDLKAGYAALDYNFGNDQYPAELYSKYLYLASDPVPPVVPEPTMIFHLMAIGGLVCGWSFSRRRLFA